MASDDWAFVRALLKQGYDLATIRDVLRVNRNVLCTVHNLDRLLWRHIGICHEAQA